tara:strand:+ start:194 stop:1090 length:897 start_codon:yes stop_codon:yes gene_type:complete
MDISVIIVSYNVKEYIISCIESIYKHSQSNYNFEIVVVDNNSKDGSVDSIKKKFPKISLIENDYNAGFSKAVNQGAKISRGTYFLILNPDTLFIEDSLFKILNEAQNKEKLGAIGPALISSNQKIQQSFWKDPSLFNTILSIYHLDYFNFNKNYKYEKLENSSKVDTISGGAIFLLKKRFSILNGFNEDLFWMEDIDLCIRLRKMGNSVYYFPLTKIIHYKGKSAKTNYKISISNQLISKIKFFRIHHSNLSAFIISFSVIFVSLIKSFLMLFFSPFSISYRKKMIAYLFTIRSLLKN